MADEQLAVAQAAAKEKAGSQAEEKKPAAEAAKAEEEEVDELDDYDLQAPWSADGLPEPPKPKNGEYEFWIKLHSQVTCWAGQHGAARCTYEQLIGQGDAETQLKSIATLVGMDYWTALYGTRMVTKEDIVPRHLGYVLGHALTKPRDLAMKELGGAEKVSTEAKKSAKESMKDLKDPNGKRKVAKVGLKK